MKRVAIYPGSFDPITNGHLDILARACGVFDEVILVLSINPEKRGRFPMDERLRMAVESVKGIPGATVGTNEGYTVDYARKVGARFIIRGIRNEEDLSFEKELFEANKALAPEIDTIFLFADKALSSISSTQIETLAMEGKDISPFVPAPVVLAYKRRR